MRGLRTYNEATAPPTEPGGFLAQVKFSSILKHPFLYYLNCVTLL
jgi:hypothetical protein